MTVHGVMVAWQNVGILIQGASGMGKSELALDLIARGAQFIADDVVTITDQDAIGLIASCPSPLNHFLEIRGIGIINVARTYGTDTVISQHRLDMIIHLLEKSDPGFSQHRFNGHQDSQQWHQQVIPVTYLPVPSIGRLETMVDCVIQCEKLKNDGYRANEEFSQRHQDLMKRGVST